MSRTEGKYNLRRGQRTLVLLSADSAESTPSDVPLLQLFEEFEYVFLWFWSSSRVLVDVDVYSRFSGVPNDFPRNRLQKKRNELSMRSTTDR